MEVLTEKPFTGSNISVLFLGENSSEVRNAVAGKPIIDVIAVDMPSVKKFSLDSGEDTKLYCYQQNLYMKNILFSSTLKNIYSMVVLCVDSNSANSWMELENTISYISEKTKSSPVKLCVVYNRKDDFWITIEDSAKKLKIPSFAFEDLNKGALDKQLEMYANEICKTSSTKVKRYFWGQSFDLININAKNLAEVFEAAKNDYSKAIPMLKSTMYLMYEVNKRIPKNLNDENCCDALYNFLKGDGRVTADSYKYFVITKLLKHDFKATDEEAKSLIEDMVTLTGQYIANEAKKGKYAKSNVAYFMFFAKNGNSNFPSELIREIALTTHTLCEKEKEVPKQEISLSS